jgi:hypothetical protein
MYAGKETGDVISAALANAELNAATDMKEIVVYVV